MRILLPLLFASVLLAQPKEEAVWSGGALVDVVIRVVDRETSKPVSNAKIWLLIGTDYVAFKSSIGTGRLALGSRARTDDEGGALIRSEILASGSCQPDGRQKFTRWNPDGFVSVEAVGFQAYREELKKLLPEDIEIRDKKTPPVILRLKRVPNQNLRPTEH